MVARTHFSGSRWTGAGFAALFALFSLAAASPAVALSMGAIDSGTFGSITGAQVDSLTMEYDFLPEVFGGDGLVTSTVFQGVGDASGNFVYTYEIELFDAPPASVGAVLGITFEFSSIPVAVAGVGDAFYVTDDSGTHAPDLAFYQEASSTAGFRFVPQITNGRTSHQFGLFSPNAAAETVAQVIDSGARGGESIVLSNGAPQGGPNLPEPSAAALFALGFLTIARFCRTRSRA